MNLLLESDLEPLLEERPGPCLSFYLPVSGSGIQTQQGPIRLRNLLGRAATDLRAQGLDTMAVEVLLEPLEELLADLSFWNTREAGIAIFRAPGFLRAFHLPRAVANAVPSGNTSSSSPLLPLVATDETFYVLALSQNETRLLEATCRTVRRLVSADLPGSLVDALGGQTTGKDLQYHTARTGAALPAVFTAAEAMKGRSRTSSAATCAGSKRHCASSSPAARRRSCSPERSPFPRSTGRSACTRISPDRWFPAIPSP